VRWFVGLPLLAPAPDHSTLARFHAFLAQHQPQALFYDTLAFLDRLDPEDAACTPQIVDTFALQAPAAWSPRVATLLLDLCADLITAWQRHAPAAFQSALPPLDLGPILHPLRPCDALERQRLLLQATTLSQRLLADLTPQLPCLPAPARASLARLTDALAKVLADELTFDAAGHPTERTDKGDYRIISATDLEATFRKHDDDLTLGYNVALATTSTRIRAVLVTTGATPDSETPPLLLGQQQAAGLPLPPYLIMDRAGGWGKVRAGVEALSGGQTQIVAHIPSAGGADPDRFGPADFRVSSDQRACTCPNGITTTKVYAHGAGDGLSFRFVASQCRDCPLWERCRSADSKPSSHRTVFVSDYQPFLRQAAAFNQTLEGQALLSQRWQVEPTIAWLTRYQGCRRARRVGLLAAQCQLFQACALRNLLRWMGRRARRVARRPL
jgi:DDE family transposase